MDRIHIAADHGLQGDNDLRGHKGCIDRFMRGGGVATLARHGDLKLIRRRQKRPGPDGKLPRWDAGHVVEAVNLLNAPAVHHTVIDHRLTARAAFLSGLEDKDGSAIKIPRLGQVCHRAQQDRGVPIMPAGMHLPGRVRGVVNTRRLRNWEGVHIRAQPDDTAFCVGLAFDNGNDAGLADTGRDAVHANLFQPCLHKSRGFGQVIHQLWHLVERTAPGADLGQKFGQTVFDRHEV